MATYESSDVHIHSYVAGGSSLGSQNGSWDKGVLLCRYRYVVVHLSDLCTIEESSLEVGVQAESMRKTEAQRAFV